MDPKQQNHRYLTLQRCIILCLFYGYTGQKYFLFPSNKNTNKIMSPFQHTLGFIRWNSLHPERIPVMEKYRPFFAELHYSMPNYTLKTNLTADGWAPYKDVYKVVGDTMNIILRQYPNIKGLLYFHFDAWLHPFRFDDMNFRKIWFPDSMTPPFKCVTDTIGWKWWAWNDRYDRIAKNATKNVAKKYSKRYIVQENVFCGGWSDIYYIPREFFRDYITLGNVFYEAGSFHEVAIPTMINIIDLTYRLTPYHSVVTRLGDCWGDCCTNGAKPEDVKRKRCGHRIDLTKTHMKDTLVMILELGARYLNKTSREIV
ncbi:unnamed protein product [Adineta ricciae]|uniref:Uncharacterized protein n=2 Tax=Adineta ricciae TaxID=249248 RepID=A0A815SLV2_ADIRI|nr:unnamed protein product [Adineta ricciae]